MQTQPCWRVAVRFYRKDVLGRTHVIERAGPVIQADSEADAIARAEVIFSGNLDFAAAGAASYLHTGHVGMIASPTERRPSTPPGLTFEESLLRMAQAAHRRRGH